MNDFLFLIFINDFLKFLQPVSLPPFAKGLCVGMAVYLLQPCWGLLQPCLSPYFLFIQDLGVTRGETLQSSRFFSSCLGIPSVPFMLVGLRKRQIPVDIVTSSHQTVFRLTSIHQQKLASVTKFLQASSKWHALISESQPVRNGLLHKHASNANWWLSHLCNPLILITQPT